MSSGFRSGFRFLKVRYPSMSYSALEKAASKCLVISAILNSGHTLT